MNYVRPEDAEKAINTLNGLRLQNKTIKVMTMPFLTVFPPLLSHDVTVTIFSISLHYPMTFCREIPGYLVLASAIQFVLYTFFPCHGFPLCLLCCVSLRASCMSDDLSFFRRFPLIELCLFPSTFFSVLMSTHHESWTSCDSLLCFCVCLSLMSSLTASGVICSTLL